MPASVSPRYLLEGAAYALEQCGLLLRDANLLYRSSSYASAVALAAFAQEELGRWKMLHELRRKVLGGDSVTIKQIQTRCGDHVRKQEAGVMSVGVVGRHRHLHLRSIRLCPDRDPIGRPPMGFPEGVATSSVSGPKTIAPPSTMPKAAPLICRRASPLTTEGEAVPGSMSAPAHPQARLARIIHGGGGFWVGSGE